MTKMDQWLLLTGLCSRSAFALVSHYWHLLQRSFTSHTETSKTSISVLTITQSDEMFDHCRTLYELLIAY